MSNLPKETIDKINAEADKYGFVVPYNGSKSFYIEDKVKGYQAGATEWASNAQPVIESIEQIANSPEPANEREMASWIATARMTAIVALAKYKEATNG